MNAEALYDLNRSATMADASHRARRSRGDL